MTSLGSMVRLDRYGVARLLETPELMSLGTLLTLRLYRASDSHRAGVMLGCKNGSEVGW